MQITVIGAASIDIYARSKRKIVPGSSDNPADVSLRAGGQARNISSMLAQRGVDVSLITAVGDDPLGILLKESCENLGIKMDSLIIKRNMCTCVNLNNLEHDGKLFAGFSSMTAPESIKSSDITRNRDLIYNADLLIMDLNLTEKILITALEVRAKRAVLIDGVSALKSPRIGNLLKYVSYLKLNRRQAEGLTGITLDTKDRVKHACYSLVDRGAKRVFITLGVAGACAADENSTIFVPALPIAVSDVTGAGAAFVTGLAMGMDFDLRTQAEMGVTYAKEHLEAYVKRRR